jgi:hypothetical protein
MLAAYVLHIIGTPLQPLTSMETLAAALAVLPTLVLMLRFYLSPRKQPGDRLSNVVASHAAMLIVAALCMALMVTLGRLKLAGGGIAPRYDIIAFVFLVRILGPGVDDLASPYRYHDRFNIWSSRARLTTPRAAPPSMA